MRETSRAESHSNGRRRTYDAFISYSRSADGKLGPAVQRGLQRFAKPWYRLRALRVFRDDASLSANPDLWGSITHALDESEYFVLLASPAAAESQWVAKEAEYWLEHRDAERMLIVLTEGELFWVPGRGVDRTRTSALPEPLDDAFDDEPRYVDLRWARGNAQLQQRDARFRDALADLAAPIHGRSKDEMLGEDVRQHRRTLRIAWGAAAVLAALTVAASALAVLAVQQRDRARTQASIALSRQLAAESAAQLDGPSAISPLLALESFRRVQAMSSERSYDARNAMLVALERSPRLVATLAASELREASFSPDGTTLATGDSSGRVQFWSTRDGHPLGPPRSVSRAGARGMSYSPDGRTLAFGDEQGRVTLWDVDAQQPRGDPLRATRYINLIVFSPDGRRIAVAGEDATSDRAMVWAADDLQARPRVLNAETTVEDAAFTPDGDTLLATDLNGDVESWSLRRSAARRHVARGYVFTTDGDRRVLVLAPARRGARIVDAVSGDPRGPRIPVTGEFFLGAAPGGRTVAQGSSASAFALWNVRGSKLVRETLPTAQGGFARPVFSAEGTRLATVGQDGTVKLWLARDPNPLGEELSHGSGSADVSSVALGPGGTAAGGGSSSVTIWARAAAKTHQATWGAQSLAFSPTRPLLATGDTSGGVMFWNPVRQTRLASPRSPHRQAVWSLAFSANGNRLTSRSADGVVAVWDTSGATPTLNTRTTKIALPRSCPGADPSGKYEQCPDAPMSVAFTPDGTLVYGTREVGVRFWDPKRRQSLGGLGDKGTEVHLTPDGATLATLSFDGALRLWDLARRQPLGRPLTDPAGSGAAGFKSDGTELVSATRGGDVTVWDPILLTTDFDAWRRRLCRLAGRNLTKAEWAQFLPGEPYRTSCPAST